MQQINLANFSRSQMIDHLSQLGEKSFRGEQVFKWIHQQGIIDFDEMSNLSKSLRVKLMENCVVEFPEVTYEKPSVDGTYKWIIKLADGNCIETVYIPERGRGTLCVSSQVGCALACTFCSTGYQGFNRNLSVAEIIGQVWLATRRLSKDGTSKSHVITNVVMMGMGEPLLNFDAVVSAMDIMLDDLAYGLSKYRVTLSTSGIVPKMRQLAKLSPAALAVSLHAPNDELRNEIVPINRKFPLEQLMQACREHFKDEPRRHITFEYVMLDGINDQLQQADQLLLLVKGISCKVNLIPFNSFPQADYRCSPMRVIKAFQQRLMAGDINTTIRKTRGDDIDAACGQLVGEVKVRIPRAIVRSQQMQNEVCYGE